MSLMIRIFFVIIALFATALLIIACGNPVRPAPEQATPTVQVSTQLANADQARGEQLFQANQCVACHGPQGQGAIGPTLAHTALSFDQFLNKVRNAIPPKPAFSAEALPDQGVYDIYGWLQTVAVKEKPLARPALAVVKIEPGQEQLPDGPILGMSLWTSFRCDSCHGAFAQGASKAPVLAGISYPYEMERAKMRQTADKIPEHAQSFMRDTVLKRLYEWLKAGANPEGGC